MAKKVSTVSFECFYEATGRASASWQLLEDGLLDVFSRTVLCSIAGTAILKSSDPTVIMGTIFYSSTNLRGRLAMMTSIIERMVTDPAILSEWNAIKNRTIDLYKRRNTMAHGHVWGSGGEAETVAASIFADGNRNAMNYVQVLAAEQAFRKIAARAGDLAARINAHLAKPAGT